MNKYRCITLIIIFFVFASFSVQAQNKSQDLACDSSLCAPFVLNTDPNEGMVNETPESSCMAFILDRSGSMEGHKLESVRKAVTAEILKMSADNIISINSFADNGKTDQPNLSQKEIFKNSPQILSAVRSGGQTNIGAGLSVARKQLEGSKKGYAILLSDGMGGNWRNEANKYRDNNWKVHTLGFGDDADVKTLQEIARITGGVYSHANSSNINNRMREQGDVMHNYSQILSVTDTTSPTGKKEYSVEANDKAKIINLYTGWQGGKISTLLVTPSGARIDAKTLSGEKGSYSDGGTFQNIKINNPEAGEWGIEVSCSDSPTKAEIINLSVMEKSDLFTYIHSFKPSYKVGEPVELLVEAMEIINEERIPLKDVEIVVDIQVPGKNIENLANNPKDEIEPYREVEKEQKRQFKLVDDGKIDVNNVGDYKAGDSIFWGVFKETKETGIYAVKAKITGKKADGTEINREIISTFQVGNALKNNFDTSQMLKAYGRIWDNITEAELANDNFYSSVKKDVDYLFRMDDSTDDSTEESYGFE